MDFDLKNKTAIICGATQGIGFGIAKEFSNQDVNLILIARNKKKLISCIKLLKNPEKHSFICVDFSKPKDLRKSLYNYFKKHKPTVHVLINNTGGPPSGLINKAQVEDFTKAFDMHVLCNQILVQAVVPGMKKVSFGRIINIISTSVKIPIAGLGVSNTVRGAVASWAKTMANELGEFQITVNNILPGYTNTSRLSSLFKKMSLSQKTSVKKIKSNIINSIPAKRLGLVNDIAYAATFLASPRAAYINGVSIPVDGGRTGSL